MGITKGWLNTAKKLESPNVDLRPDANDISLLVIHNISLPPAQFGGSYIEQLFSNNLNPDDHPYFRGIHKLQVSSHLLIDRQGNVTQFVPFDQRAWHAGVSEFEGRQRCNDFSIGIELEGTDDIAYNDIQYSVLAQISQQIMTQYPAISMDRIVGHSDIAPERKTDPGQAFDWQRYKQLLNC
ncbi:MAG: 1,6-anhydro-N-acetylmuramyl-L-alanine amidase AmpD [Porticoccaceae bacterium]|nr:1,6-anhydro-N-acetylmuramyl-L-alanine amidase AmpD [Porticoccaceae bacterium]